MGRIITPTFRLEIETDSPKFRFTSQVWDVRSKGMIRGSGNPTPDNIAQWVRDFEASCKSGSNAHIGPVRVIVAKIIRQATDEIVAEWRRGHR